VDVDLDSIEKREDKPHLINRDDEEDINFGVDD